MFPRNSAGRPEGGSRNCLVLGGRGFVGSAIARAAEARGWRVFVAGRQDWAACRGRAYDLVVNASGNASRIGAVRDPAADFAQSVETVFRSLFEFRYSRYALVSTVDVYNDTSHPGATTEETPIDPTCLSAYGFHKRLAELGVMRHAPSWQIFRLAQMLGPGLKKGPIFDLLAGSPLWVDPSSAWPFLRTRQVAEALLALAENGAGNDVYNLCGRGSVQFAEALPLFGQHVDELRFAGRELQNYRINTDKAHAVVHLPDSREELLEFARDAGVGARRAG